MSANSDKNINIDDDDRHHVIEWYYNNFQAVSKAQSRYMFLLLVYWLGNFGMILSSKEVYPLLGIALPRKYLLELFPLAILFVLKALFGTYAAAGISHQRLMSALRKEGLTLPVERMYPIDPAPNLFDFWAYRVKYKKPDSKSDSGKSESKLPELASTYHPFFCSFFLVSSLCFCFYATVWNDAFPCLFFCGDYPEIGNPDFWVGLILLFL